MTPEAPPGLERILATWDMFCVYRIIDRLLEFNRSAFEAACLAPPPFIAGSAFSGGSFRQFYLLKRTEDKWETRITYLRMYCFYLVRKYILFYERGSPTLSLSGSGKLYI